MKRERIKREMTTFFDYKLTSIDPEKEREKKGEKKREKSSEKRRWRECGRKRVNYVICGILVVFLFKKQYINKLI
jgi:hypothetical protein